MTVTDSPDMRELSHCCWQPGGWHAYMAGPCFDTIEQAREYRDELNVRGLTWWPIADKPRLPKTT